MDYGIFCEEKKEESPLFQQLEPKDYYRVSGLVVNFHHELAVDAVIKNLLQGEIYADDDTSPRSALLMTPECNVVAGYAANHEFNAGVRQRLDFHDDAIMCDTEEWAHHMADIHSNRAVRRYTRLYYELTYPNDGHLESLISALDARFTLEYVWTDNQDYLQYENAEAVTNWFNFMDMNDVCDDCLGAYVRTKDRIVSWCLADCIVGDRMEIGVVTDALYRRQGLATIAVAAAVQCSSRNGISHWGWHCVDSNIASCTVAESIGFVKAKEYSSYTPYPPIENVSDLTDDQWAGWGRHYDEMNKSQPKYHWQAAQCWAFAHDPENTIKNIRHLWSTGRIIDRDTLFEQCGHLAGYSQWDAFVTTLHWEDAEDGTSDGVMRVQDGGGIRE